jgi:hypothetical protein
MDWRKSSFSGQNGSCLETASNSGAVLVRDTTDRNGPMLTFSAEAWQVFVGGLK